MESRWIKGLLPLFVLGFSMIVFMAVNAFAKRELEEAVVDSTPLVRVETAMAENYQIAITAHGTVEPMEVTPIAAQVAGEVVSTSPQFLDGDLVKRGERLFTVDKESYQAALLQAQANLINAEANLVEQQAQADVAADEARRNPQKQYTDLFLRKPQVLTAKANVKSAQAALKLAQRDLEKCEIHAPFDALVVNKNIGLGQFVSVGSPAATLYNVETAKVVLPIPGFDSIFLPERVAGLPASVEDRSLLGVKREAEVLHDLGIVNESTRMSQLLVKIDDPYGLKNSLPAIKFGTFVKISLPGKTLDHVYKLPQKLVNDRTVWVVNEQSKLEPRKVVVVREEGEFYFIREGLSDQDRIVTTPPEYPQRGMLVKVVDGQVSVSTASAAL